MADGFAALAAKHGHSPPPAPDYAFTEFVTINFLQPVRLEDKTTAAGQVWEKTIQTYLSTAGTAGTKALWWGHALDNRQTVKLIIDWSSSSNREAFLASQAMSSLLASWQSDTDVGYSSSSPTFFELSPETSVRLNVFRPPRAFSEDCITILLTFHFSASFDPEAVQPDDEVQPPRSRRAVWENAWSVFAHSALRSEGGIISSRGEGGWSVWEAPGGKCSWMGAFRFMNADLARRFLALAEEEIQGSQRGGWGRLKSLADAGVEVELLSMVHATEK